MESSFSNPMEPLISVLINFPHSQLLRPIGRTCCRQTVLVGVWEPIKSILLLSQTLLFMTPFILTTCLLLKLQILLLRFPLFICLLLLLGSFGDFASKEKIGFFEFIPFIAGSRRHGKTSITSKRLKRKIYQTKKGWHEEEVEKKKMKGFDSQKSNQEKKSK